MHPTAVMKRQLSAFEALRQDTASNRTLLESIADRLGRIEARLGVESEAPDVPPPAEPVAMPHINALVKTHTKRPSRPSPAAAPARSQSDG